MASSIALPPPPLRRTEKQRDQQDKKQVETEVVRASFAQLPALAQYKRKGFYVNGLNSAGESAQQACEDINIILEWSPLNGSWPDKASLREVELHEIENGVVFNEDYRNRSITNLCDKVRFWLNGEGQQSEHERTPRLALFGHSAGAYVVARAYEQLEPVYQNSVRVVLFGGVGSIEREELPDDLAYFEKGIIQLHHEGDYLAKAGRWVVECGRTKVCTDTLIEIPHAPISVESPPEASLIPHGSKDYLENQVVRAAINWAMEADPL